MSYRANRFLCDLHSTPVKTASMRSTCLFGLLFIISVTAFSQTGKITGKVINASSGQNLANATLTLIEKSMMQVADQNGNFSFGKLAPGTYSIRCTYAGYLEKTVSEIVVRNAEVASLTISLEEKKMDAVVVTSTKVRAAGESISSLLIVQKNSANVMDGITAQQIKVTPDKTTSDVLKRVSGASIQEERFAVIRGLNDRYNAAFINGAP